MRAHGFVHRQRRGQALADRLFHHHAGAVARQAGVVEPVAYRPEQLGRGGEVEHPAQAGIFVQAFGQRRPARVVGGVGGGAAEAGEEALERGRLDRLALGAHRLAGEGAEVVVGERAARGSEDTRAIGDLPRRVAVVKGGQQLALGEVASGAEDNEVERIDRDHSRGHAPPPFNWNG